MTHLTEFVKTKPYLLAKLMRKESSMRQEFMASTAAGTYNDTQLTVLHSESKY